MKPTAIRRGVAAALTLVAVLAAAPAMAFEPRNAECIAPAGPGGGWDFTCRQVGKLMEDMKLLPGSLRVVNRAGGNGAVAFAEVVNSRNASNDLIVAASSATATRLGQKAYPGNDMTQVRWVGSVGAEYGIIAVAKNSPIKTLPELMDKIKADPNSVAIAGGSAFGGWDHLKVLIAAKKAGVADVRKVKYVAFEGGGEAVTQLLSGAVQAFSGDPSEAKGFIDSGDIRVIAVLAPERLGGDFAKLPTAREQGIDAIGANWRGFFIPGGASNEAYAYWSNAVAKVGASQEWKEVMRKSGLAPLDLTGEKFKAFVESSINDIAALSKEIGIIK